MRKQMLALVMMLLALIASPASAQFFTPERVGHLTSYHTTVGTSTALAIPSASVGINVISWKICNDAVNTSTYLLVGMASDVSTDGASLAPGACFECEQCTSSMLKLMKVEGQAASNGYSVIQYRK